MVESNNRNSILEESLNPLVFEPNSVEQALEKVGDNNFYQIRFLLIFFAQWMVSVFTFVGPVYYFPDPQFQCSDRSTCFEDNGGCNDQILIESPYTTITSDFELYCDSRNLRSIAQSSLFLCPIVGNIFFSFLADWKGRRISLNIAWTLSLIGIVGISFSYNVYYLISMILLTGFGLVPCNNLNLIIVNEQGGEKFRQRGSTLLLTSWAFFQIVLVPIAKYIHNWRNIFLYFIAIPCVIVTALNFFFIYESPRFLLVKERRKVMYKTLNKIAKTNKKQQITEENFYIAPIDVTDEDKVYTYLDLVKYKSLRMITFSSCFVMFFTQLIYYSTQYSLGDFGYDLYANSLVVGGCELFAYIICSLLIIKLPRKWFTFIFYTTCVILCCLFPIFPSDIVQTVFIGIIRVFNCGTLGILALFVEELYPTTVRSLGVGIQMSFGVAGSALAPIIIDQAKQLGINPLLASGVLSIPAIFTIAFFKETRGKPLQDDIIELQIDAKVTQIISTENTIKEIL